MQRLRDRSIQQKITLVVLLICSVVLLVACSVLFAFQAYTIQQHFIHEIGVVGEITARNCAAAAVTGDEKLAGQTLAGLRVMPQIVGALLLLPNGEALAALGSKNDQETITRAGFTEGYRIQGERVGLAQAIVRDGRRVGTLYLLADYLVVSRQLLQLYGTILALVLAASLLFAFLLSGRFQKLITRPILNLARTARTIADHKDYSVRAEKVSGAEVGLLTDAFNQMLAQIQSQDGALQGAQRKLEEKVAAFQREIEERQKAKADQARLAAILEATPDVVGSADPDGNAFFLNRAGREMLGVALEEDIGTRKFHQVHPDWAAELIEKEALPHALRFGSWSGETAVINYLGQEIQVSQVLIAHKNPEGELQYFSTVMRDMTERRRTDEALRDSQQRLVETSRLAGMAEVATGVLHNVGNVLNSVNVSAGLVVEKLRRSKAPKLSKAAALLT
ncbi:MAG: HAMP domain-containing protein, partial [Luteimonas sp.]